MVQIIFQEGNGGKPTASKIDVSNRHRYVDLIFAGGTNMQEVAEKLKDLNKYIDGKAFDNSRRMGLRPIDNSNIYDLYAEIVRTLGDKGLISPLAAARLRGNFNRDIHQNRITVLN